MAFSNQDVTQYVYDQILDSEEPELISIRNRIRDENITLCDVNLTSLLNEDGCLKIKDIARPIEELQEVITNANEQDELWEILIRHRPDFLRINPYYRVDERDSRYLYNILEVIKYEFTESIRYTEILDSGGNLSDFYDDEDDEDDEDNDMNNNDMNNND